jgi:hypothetical protein
MSKNAHEVHVDFSHCESTLPRFYPYIKNLNVHSLAICGATFTPEEFKLWSLVTPPTVLPLVREIGSWCYKYLTPCQSIRFQRTSVEYARSSRELLHPFQSDVKLGGTDGLRR